MYSCVSRHFYNMSLQFIPCALALGWNFDFALWPIWKQTPSEDLDPKPNQPAKIVCLSQRLFKPMPVITIQPPATMSCTRMKPPRSINSQIRGCCSVWGKITIPSMSCCFSYVCACIIILACLHVCVCLLLCQLKSKKAISFLRSWLWQLFEAFVSERTWRHVIPLSSISVLVCLIEMLLEKQSSQTQGESN